MARKGNKLSKRWKKLACLPLCCGGEDIRVHAAGNVYEQSEEEEENVKTRKPKPKPSQNEDEATLYSLPSIISYAENPYIEENKTRHDNYVGRFEKTPRSADITHESPSLSERGKKNHTTVIQKQAHEFEKNVHHVRDENSGDFSFDETIPMKILIQMGKAKESPAQTSDEGSSGLSRMVEPGTTHKELSSDSRPSIDDQNFEAEADETSNDFDANFQILDGEEVAEMGVAIPAEKEVLDTEAGVAESCLAVVKLQAEPSSLLFDAAAPQHDEKTVDAKSMDQGSDSGSSTDPELYRVVDFNVSPYVSSDSSIEKISSAKSIFNQEKQLATVGRDISSMDIEKKTLSPLAFGPEQVSSSLFVKPKSKVSFISAVPGADQSLTTDSPLGHVKPVSCLEGTMSISTRLGKAPKELESYRGIGHSDHSSHSFSQDKQQVHSAKKTETTLAPVKVGLEPPLQRHEHSQIKCAKSSDVNKQLCHLSTEYKQRVDENMLTNLHQPKQQSALPLDHQKKSHHFRPDLLKDESNLHPSKIQTKELQAQVQKSQLLSLTSSDLKGEKSNLQRLQMETTYLPAHLHRPQLQPALLDHLQSELSHPAVASKDKPLLLYREKIQPPSVGIGPKSPSFGHESVSQQSERQFPSVHQTHLHRPQLQPMKVQVSGSDLKKQQPHLRVEKTQITSYVVGSSIEQIQHSSSFLSQVSKVNSFERVMNIDGTTLLDHPQAESFPAPKEINPEKLGTVLPSGSKLKRPAMSPLQVNKPSSLSDKKDISFSTPTNKMMQSSSTANENHVPEPLSSSPPFEAEETILKTINFNDIKSSRVLERPNALGEVDPIQPAKWNSSSSTKTGRRFYSKLPEAILTPYAKSAPDARVVNPKATSKSIPKSDDALSQGASASNSEPASKQARRKGTKCRRDMLTEKNQIPKSPSPPEYGRSRRGKTYRTKTESNRADTASPYLKEPCPPPIGKKTQARQKVMTPPRNTSESDSSDIKPCSTRPRVDSGRADPTLPYAKESRQSKEKKTQQQVPSPIRIDSESSSCETELHSPRPAWNLTKADSKKTSLSGMKTNFRSTPYKESSSDCAAASDVTDNEEVAQIQEEESRPHIPRPPPSSLPSDRRHSRPFPPLRRQRVENLSLRTTASTDGKHKKQVSFNLPNLDRKTSVAGHHRTGRINP